ncbi:hypothetical protein WR25_25128 [Diploscapter pachys]|uniref:Uncharacterized protein n=1 Tax=Diploscapter pachys TaxID=2018661 RepID=A0A2A2LWD8_9BILA|nr:hypothetical protein WR25_25128 [Diploscapter pachys]
MAHSMAHFPPPPPLYSSRAMSFDDVHRFSFKEAKIRDSSSNSIQSNSIQLNLVNVTLKAVKIPYLWSGLAAAKEEEKLKKKDSNRTNQPQEMRPWRVEMCRGVKGKLQQNKSEKERKRRDEILNNVDLDHSLGDWRRAGPGPAQAVAPFNRAAFNRLHNPKNMGPGADNHFRGPRGGSLSSSSPMTSSEEGNTMDPWSSQKESNLPTRRSPPAYNSNHKRAPVSKTIEVKVERSEKVERIEKNSSNSNAVGDVSRNHSIQQDTYAQPIVRNHSAYGSRSSLATSQLRGDQSEIDFSWVNEVQDKLKKEQKKGSGNKHEERLPECYFGMEPPQVREDASRKGSEKENRERERDRSSVMNKAAIFEEESRRRQALRAKAAAEPCPDYNRLNGNSPSERRLHRIQHVRERESDNRQEHDRRWRSSLAL